MNKDLTKACIRNTITSSAVNAKDLNPREVERAVEVGVAIADSSPGKTTWGNIARSAVAAVKDNRGR